jgi:anti-sigma-K factor RskA
MTHEQFEEAIPLYVVGSLERAERQAFEAHLLGGCATCRAALEEYRPVVAKLPFALPRAAVPPELKTKLLTAIAQPAPAHEAPLASGSASREPAQESVEASAGWLGLPAWLSHPAWALASVLILLVAAWYAQSSRTQTAIEIVQRQRAETALRDGTTRLMELQRQVAVQEQTLASLREEKTHRSGDLGEIQAALASREAELDELRIQLTRRERELTGLRTVLAQRDEMLTFLRSPSVKVISLAGLEKAKAAGAFLLFDPESKKAFFYAFNMPPLPGGKIYQLWAIVDKPVSAGTFSTDAGQKARLVVRSAPDLARITKFAVSVEPEGGRPQPTGDIYLMGQL